VDSFDQTDLNDEDVFLLDTYTQLFVWVGSKSNSEERAKSLEVAKNFIATADDGRDESQPIVSVNAGSEPDIFSSYFLPWDPEYTTKRLYVDPYQAKLAKAKEENKEVVERRMVELKKAAPPPAAPAVEEQKPAWAKADTSAADEPPAPAPSPAPKPAAAAAASASSLKGKFSYDDLKAGLPDGVDHTSKELYLDDATFVEVFKMQPAEFAALPKWKRDTQKKAVGLS